MIEKLPKLRLAVEHILCKGNPDAESPSVALWNRLLRDAEFHQLAKTVIRFRKSKDPHYAASLERLALMVIGAMVHERCFRAEQPPALEPRTLKKYRKAWLLHYLACYKKTIEQVAAHKLAATGWPHRFRPLPLAYWLSVWKTGDCRLSDHCARLAVQPNERMDEESFRQALSRMRTKDYPEWEEYYRKRCEAYKEKLGYTPWDAFYETHVLSGNKSDEEFDQWFTEVWVKHADTWVEAFREAGASEEDDLTVP